MDNKSVILPKWIDKIIFDDFEAVYEPCPMEVVYNPDQPYEFVKCKHSKKCTFYTLRFGCSFAAVNTIKPQLL